MGGSAPQDPRRTSVAALGTRPVRRQLGKRFAQQIVNQIAATLDQNVNLMDAQGVIIASCDPARIGDVHEAARQVIRTGEPVAVHSDDYLAGALPGLNYPLRAGEEIIGVVGITGDPAEVAPIGNVVRLATQLLIEHAAEQDASERREAADRSIITALIRPDERLTGVERELLASERAVLAPWWLTLFLPLDPVDRVDELDRSVEARLGAAGVRWAETRGALWVLSGVSDKVARLTEGLAHSQRFLAVVGAPAADLAVLRATGRGLAALASRRAVLDGRAVLEGGPRVERLVDLAAEVAVAQLPLDQCRLLAECLAPLSDVLRQTVAAMAAHRTVAEATLALHAHRNTVSQRVDRIVALTGLDPREPRQMQNLVIAMCAARVLEGDTVQP